MAYQFCVCWRSYPRVPCFFSMSLYFPSGVTAKEGVGTMLCCCPEWDSVLYIPQPAGCSNLGNSAGGHDSVHLVCPPDWVLDLWSCWLNLLATLFISPEWLNTHHYMWDAVLTPLDISILNDGSLTYHNVHMNAFIGIGLSTFHLCIWTYDDGLFSFRIPSFNLTSAVEVGSWWLWGSGRWCLVIFMMCRGLWSFCHLGGGG